MLALTPLLGGDLLYDLSLSIRLQYVDSHTDAYEQQKSVRSIAVSFRATVALFNRWLVAISASVSVVSGTAQP
jgi:hypothetical protein